MSIRSNPATRNMRNVPSAGVLSRACQPMLGWVARTENVSSAAARKRSATSRLALREAWTPTRVGSLCSSGLPSQNSTDARTSGGLFEQRELGQAGLLGRHYGELAGFFVEGSGDGQDDILIGQRKLLGVAPSRVPSVAEGGDVARRDFHGGEHAAGFGRIPREDFGGAVHIGIGEPGLGGVHQLGGHQRALLARVDADGLAVFEEEERRQGAARLGAAGGDQLRRFEDVDGGEVAIFGFAFVDVGEGGVGGAEIDADFHWIVQDWAGLCGIVQVGGVGGLLYEQSQFLLKLLESICWTVIIRLLFGWRVCGGARVI